ncbi:MAG: hypothetical protein WD270_10815 [Acetobacterales bacterium]
MIGEALSALEASALATALRGSTWTYPLVNAGHVLGIALLFGSVVPLDLRLLGLWRGVPPEIAARMLVPVAAAGFALAATTGTLLFVSAAGDYAASWLFRLKLAVLAAALGNVLLFLLARPAADTEPTPGQRGSALASLTLWAGVIVAGRLVGYF